MKPLPARHSLPSALESECEPLLFIHGFTGSSGVWDDSIDQLRDVFAWIAVDLPGHGKSNGTMPEVISFQSVCQSIVATLDQFGVGSTNVWGYSMGGRIALHLALEYPGRVRRLILESVSPGITDDTARATRLKEDEALAKRIETAGIESFVDSWTQQPLFLSQKSLPADRQERARKLRLLHSPVGLASALRGLSVGRQEPLHHRLQELIMPTLVIAGALDQKYSACAATMARSIPNAQLCILPDAGHAPHWEKPHETAVAVREFLLADTV